MKPKRILLKVKDCPNPARRDRKWPIWSCIGGPSPKINEMEYAGEHPENLKLAEALVPEVLWFADHPPGGKWNLSRECLISALYEGLLLTIRTHDPDRGASLRTWWYVMTKHYLIREKASNESGFNRWLMVSDEKAEQKKHDLTHMMIDRYEAHERAERRFRLLQEIFTHILEHTTEEELWPTLTIWDWLLSGKLRYRPPARNDMVRKFVRWLPVTDIQYLFYGDRSGKLTPGMMRRANWEAAENMILRVFRLISGADFDPVTLLLYNNSSNKE